MSKVLYFRKNKIMIDTDSKKASDFESINKAKRESRKIQMQNDGALGRGSVKLKA